MKEVSAGIIVRNGKILIGQRPEGKPLAGYWEFPGGKRESGETIEECLVRELREELGIDAVVGSHIMDIVHQYPDGLFRISLFFAKIGDEINVDAQVHQKLAWAGKEDLDKYDFLPADADIIETLKKIDWQ